MQRDKTIDIAKGICIILMVMGHSGSPLTHFIYLFHMACFFIISGYCYKDSYNLSIKDVFRLVVSRLKTLYVPYVFINIVYLLMHNVFFKIGFITNNEFFLEVAEKSGANTLVNPLNNEQILRKAISICLFIGDSNFAGSATWFLRVLFIVNITFALLMFVFKNNKYGKYIVLVISMIVMVIAWYMTLLGTPDYLNLITSGETLVMFAIGFIIKTDKLADKISWKRVYFIASMIILIIGNCISIGVYEPVSLASAYIRNPLFYLIMSVCGFGFVYYLSMFIGKMDRICSVFNYVGKRTMVILMLHFVGFKLVTFVIINICNKDMILLASYPVLFFREIRGLWWLLYSFIGVVLPLLADTLLSVLRKSVKGGTV